MRSIKEIFVIGNGPSSSHTMGPAKACDYILLKYKNIKNIKITLFGSLSRTGKGHLTDYIIDLKFKNIPHEIIFDLQTKTEHPNTMLFLITDSNNKEYSETVISIGGGTIVTNNEQKDVANEVFPHNSLNEILKFCGANLSLSDYVRKFESKDIDEYIIKCINKINSVISIGISKDGYLPGNLKVKRKAKDLFLNNNSTIEEKMIYSAFAVAEENASGGEIVLSPTCGSCGVFGGITAYCNQDKFSNEDRVNAMLVAGLIGIIAKTNASISGAEAGCQAEIGVACAMGAAAIACINKLDNNQIAQAAEIAMEHSLGLTCDPINGYVQIPCIERCAIFSLKAKNAAQISSILPSSDNKITFDKSLKAMYSTGKDLESGYKETSEKGLAKILD